jgi:hypothetical protein
LGAGGRGLWRAKRATARRTGRHAAHVGHGGTRRQRNAHASIRWGLYAHARTAMPLNSYPTTVCFCRRRLRHQRHGTQMVQKKPSFAHGDGNGTHGHPDEMNAGVRQGVGVGGEGRGREGLAISRNAVERTASLSRYMKPLACFRVWSLKFGLLERWGWASASRRRRMRSSVDSARPHRLPCAPVSGGLAWRPPNAPNGARQRYPPPGCRRLYMIRREDTSLFSIGTRRSPRGTSACVECMGRLARLCFTCCRMTSITCFRRPYSSRLDWLNSATTGEP